jgi:hypothetical protein
VQEQDRRVVPISGQHRRNPAACDIEALHYGSRL